MNTDRTSVSCCCCTSFVWILICCCTSFVWILICCCTSFVWILIGQLNVKPAGGNGSTCSGQCAAVLQSPLIVMLNLSKVYMTCFHVVSGWYKLCKCPLCDFKTMVVLQEAGAITEGVAEAAPSWQDGRRWTRSLWDGVEWVATWCVEVVVAWVTEMRCASCSLSCNWTPMSCSGRSLHCGAGVTGATGVASGTSLQTPTDPHHHPWGAGECSGLSTSCLVESTRGSVAPWNAAFSGHIFCTCLKKEKKWSFWLPRHVENFSVTICSNTINVIMANLACFFNFICLC